MNWLTTITFLSFAAIGVSKSSAGVTAHEIAKMHRYMNETINPCNDFYQYSCGNWLNSHEHVINDPINNLDRMYNEKLEKLMTAKKSNEKHDTILQRLRTFYKSCKEQKSFEPPRYMELIKPMENESWPAYNQTWQPATEWNMWQTLGELHGIGLRDLFFSVSWNKDNMTSYELILTQCNTFRAMKEERKDIFDNVVQFSIKLYDLCSNLNEENSTYMTISELQQEIPSIDFESYFSRLLKDVPSLLNSISLKIENLSYFKDLENLISETSQDTLIHTMKLFLQTYLDDILPENCITTMREVLPLALNVAYKNYEYHRNAKTTNKIVQKIFNELQSKFINILKTHENEFSPEEKLFLYEKISQMKLNIGNLQLNEKPQFYKKYYEDWLALQNEFYYNHLNALRHKTLEKLGLSSFLLRFSQTFENNLQVFYPFYLFGKNVLVLPFQYLQYPNFQPKFNPLLLYGDLGYSMSHAMMYGFSSFGLQYNAAGERNISLAQSFLEKPPLLEAVECVNASNSIELDIKMTDFIGFRLAYDTYFEDVANVAEKRLDCKFTNRQLFYLRYAQSECIVRRLPTYTELRLAIQNVVENSRDFEKAFGCLPGEDEPVREKCEIW